MQVNKQCLSNSSNLVFFSLSAEPVNNSKKLFPVGASQLLPI